MTYVDGFVLSIEQEKIEEYREMAEAAGKTWLKHGALEYKECIADDMEDKGFCATFPATFKPKPGEVMVLPISPINPVSTVMKLIRKSIMTLK